MSERLERIKSRGCNESEPGILETDLTFSDIDYLIDQAEKGEKSIQQNQRYRKTLRKIVEVPPDEPSSVKMALYYQSLALEGLEEG